MAQLESLVQRLEAAVISLESVSGLRGSPGNSAGGAVVAYVEAFDEIVKGPVAQYMSLSQKIGGEVQQHAEMVKQGFSAEREVLVMASSFQKPADGVAMSLLQPVLNVIQQAQAFRETVSRSSPLFNHLSAVSESVPGLAWVAMAPKPGPYVKESQDSGMFYTNRVLKEYKEKDKTHVEWVKAYLAIWIDLQNYIKQHHTTGLTWSKSGPVASASAPASGPAPPPPPGPPPPPSPPPPSSGGSSDSGPVERNALFASLNKGADITKGLKHVGDSEKTHKNPALRGQSAPVRTGPKPFTAAAPRHAASPAVACKKPPVFELDGKKWKVENQEGAQELVISDTELKQVVYAFNCNKSTLQVKGKINSITLDSCKKLGLVFEDVVGIVDLINCKDIKIQVMGKVPTISINKTDGCHVYLSQDSLGCEIISAKSSEMNILVPKKDGEFEEIPLPEQFKTLWDGQKLVTTATEIAG